MVEVVVFAEAEADHRTATVLADRVFCEAASWVSGNLDTLRQWCGADAQQSFIRWTSVARIWRQLRPATRRALHGRYGGPQKGEYLQARKAILLAADLVPSARAVLLVRDADCGGRRADYEQARNAHARQGRAVAIGV